ncbi:hypothetical protein EDD16DRAFT_1826633 [Pisolithus croceorrhizus]|nr:hypothetical protein EDD16DRAFT_1826633 [Pisolithus croceorrhizus]KAI6168183.1 hypothetical protein EDD17DRAFT_1685569 [Pisolithus thermaeus]
MNHPRYSVLSLFDPLATPTKEADSDRDVATPDSAAGSDKENAVPHYSGPYNSKYGDSDELTMTAFFNRTYKTQPSHFSSVPLRKRLIDVGDATVTIEDASEMLSTLAISEGSAPDMREGPSSDRDTSLDYCSTSASVAHHSETEQTQTPRPLRFPSQVRPPLADIAVDATPVPHRKNCSLASDHYSPPSTVVRVPNVRPSANIGQSPLSSLMSAMPQRGEEASCTATEIPLREEGVVIVISEPSESNQRSNLNAAYPLLTDTHLSEAAVRPSPSSVTQSLPESTAADATEDPAFLSVGPQPRLRSKAASNQETNPIRCSVDLQSSFNWQLQCPDASFDLLNDRISFFGGDSFMLSTDGDEFDVSAKEEMREALAKRQREKTAKEQKRDSSSSDVRLDLAPSDYEPDCPLVTPCEKVVMPVSPSPPHDSMSTTVRAGPRESPRANTAPSPSVRPGFESRRGSLVPLIKDPKTSPPRGDEPMHELEKVSPDPSIERVRPVQICDESTTSHPKTITPPKHSAQSSKFVAPAPVQALRIVKRPKAQQQSDSRPTSVASDSSRTTESSNDSTAGAPREPDSGCAPVLRPQSLHRPVLKGVLRPPPGHFPPPAQPPSTKPVSGVTSNIEDGRRVSIRSKLTGALGLRGKTVVPPTNIETVATATSAVVKSNPQKASAVPVASVATSSKVSGNFQAKGPSVTTGALGAIKTLPPPSRPPSRFATVSSGSACAVSSGNPSSRNGPSGLPRPVPGSRLPVPGFGMQRSKPTFGTATIGRSGTMRR